jgi:probable HAF family extracellular repeat protein
VDEFTLGSAIRRGQRRQGGAARSRALARKFVLGLLLALACQTALAQAMYRIEPVGWVGGCTSWAPNAAGFNGAYQVTGSACNAYGDTHAFLWKNDGTPMVDLGPNEVGSWSQGYALNASGLVAGSASDSTGEFAFVSSGDGTPMTRIYDGLGGGSINGYAVNDLGQVTGNAYMLGNNVAHAFLWKNDGSSMLDLGSLGGDFASGNAVNASGQVAGDSSLPDNTASHAFVWKNDGTPMHDLGTLGGIASSALAINASGQVAGTSALNIGPAPIRHHVFFWRNDGTPMQDLGTLRDPHGTESFFAALNDSGQVAGSSYTLGWTAPHAFVWLNDGTPMKDLGTFGGTVSRANDINSSGQVTGYANLAGDAVLHAFLWRNDGTKIQDLNKLIDFTDPLKPYVTLLYGAFINDFGDIVADGIDTRTGLEGMYLLRGPVFTLSPQSLAFGNRPINTTSIAKSVTVTNNSAKTAAITGIALKGSASGQFGFTDNCGKSLASHATCTIKVTFNPAAKGTKSAFLNVSGGGNGRRSGTLTGTGT